MCVMWCAVVGGYVCGVVYVCVREWVCKGRDVLWVCVRVGMAGCVSGCGEVQDCVMCVCDLVTGCGLVGVRCGVCVGAGVRVVGTGGAVSGGAGGSGWVPE